MKYTSSGWEYTPEESKVLIPRYLSRLSENKRKGGWDLNEKRPLWELMGESKKSWSERHKQMKHNFINREKIQQHDKLPWYIKIFTKNPRKHNLINYDH